MGSLSVVVGVCLLVAVFLTAQIHSNGVTSPSVVEFVGVCLLADVFQTAQNYSNVIHIAMCVCVCVCVRPRYPSSNKTESAFNKNL